MDQDAPQQASTEQTPAAPSFEDLAARVAQLQADNQNLQALRQQETAAERRARAQAESQLHETTERLARLEQQHAAIEQSALDAMSPDQLRDHAAKLSNEGRQTRHREQQAQALFQQADRLVGTLVVTNAEWRRHFDPGLEDPGFWRSNPAEAQARFERGIAALNGARSASGDVKKAVDEALARRDEDSAHERRSEAAASGAFTPDRGRGTAPAPLTSLRTPEDIWSIPEEEFTRADGIGVHLLRQAADLTAGKRP